MKQKIMIIIGILAFVGVISNLVDSIVKDESIIELFFYFTVQSNMFVALLFLYMGFTNNITRWIRRLYGGVLLYILVTFVIFVVLLQPVFHPDGFGFLANILNHYIVPLSVIVFSSILPLEGAFLKKNIKYWFIYPVSYLIGLIMYGSVTGNYLYPFFQVSEVGIFGLLLAIGGMVLLFYLFSILIVKTLSNEKNT